MPRKKVIDPLVTVLDFFEIEPEASCQIAQRIIARTLARRFPPTEKAKGVVRRKRQPKPATPPAQRAMEAVTQTAPLPPAAPKPRRRRMRAGSPPPPNEAKPIVPLQEEVGDDNTYTGN